MNKKKQPLKGCFFYITQTSEKLRISLICGILTMHSAL